MKSLAVRFYLDYNDNDYEAMVMNTLAQLPALEELHIGFREGIDFETDFVLIDVDTVMTESIILKELNNIKTLSSKKFRIPVRFTYYLYLVNLSCTVEYALKQEFSFCCRNNWYWTNLNSNTNLAFFFD